MTVAARPGLVVVYAPPPRLYGWDCIEKGIDGRVCPLRVFEIVSSPTPRGDVDMKILETDESLHTNLAYFFPLLEFPPVSAFPRTLRLTSANAVRIAGNVIPLFLGGPVGEDLEWFRISLKRLSLIGLKQAIHYVVSEYTLDGRGIRIEGVKGVFYPALFEMISSTGESWSHSFERWEKLIAWSGD